MVTDKHEAFARAVAALAREHGDNINMTFRGAFRSMPGPECYEAVSMFWHCGRHGDASNIELSTRAKQTISERA